jgi:hypothetical protein
LLNEAARSVLGEIGMFQKGRSRIWLDDHGWWIGIVEFQPSGFSKGSYLNVSAMWLWHEGEEVDFSFDFSFPPSPRVGEFISFESEEQFGAEATRLASVAREWVLKYRQAIHTCLDAANRVAARSREPGDFYYAGIAYACAGETLEAKKMFERLDQFRHGLQPEPDWVLALRLKGRNLANMIDNPTGFRESIEQRIRSTRRILKLPDLANLGLC